MELSQRAKQLSRLLLEQPAGCPLTLAELSEQMHLSKRTIQRALPEVRDWMGRHDCCVQARAGSGISVEASEEKRHQLLVELQGGAKSEQDLPQRAELLEILLDAQQVLSIEQLSERLRCSRDAIEKQLPWIRDWLARYQVILHVQTGVGLYIEGTEKNWRRARIEHIAAFHADAVMTYFSAPEQATAPLLFRVLSREEQLGLLSILRRAQNYQEIHLTDEGFLRVYLCAGLMLWRIKQGHFLYLEREEMERLQRLPEYAMAEHVADMLREYCGISPDSAEIGFLAMYFANSDVMPERNADMLTGEVHRLYLTQRILGAAQRELHLDFSADEQLVEGLYAHLQATCSRLRLGSPIENPLTQDIIDMYPDLYAAARNACEVLKEFLHVDTIPQEECAYIAMHLGAAVERMQGQAQNISAVVVCPVGMSGANHLAAEITRRFPQILVHRIVSAVNIDTRQLRRDGIDFIISTIDLSVSYPIVRVSPLLNRRDFTRIDAAITMAVQRKQEYRTEERPSTQRKDIAFLARFSDELLRLTQDIPWHQIPCMQKMEDLAYYAAHMMVAEDDIAANQLEQQLLHQLHQSDSYLQPYHRLIVCCTTEYTQHGRIGYLQLKMPYVDEEQRQVEGCLILLVPERDTTGAAASLMHKACAAILRGRAYLQDMQHGEKAAFAQRLEHDLAQCYANIVRQHLPE